MQEAFQAEERKVLEWRCLTCGKTEPPTGKGYSNLLSHPCKKRQIWLVDKESGEKLANNIGQAISQGYIPKKGEKGTDLSGDGKGEEKEVTVPEIVGDSLIRYTITLPVDAFTLFNIVRGLGLENPDMLFDEWLFACITERIRLGYKKQLVLCDIPESEEVTQ